MFRPMRRNKQQLSEKDTIEILMRNTNGVLSVIGDDGYPYGVPVSYVYCDGKIYFHCAKTGHKLDAIAANSKVSFTVVDQDQIVGAEMTTYFRSVIVFGRAAVVTDNEEAPAAFRALAEKYAADYPQRIEDSLVREVPHAALVAITIDHLTGKEAKELVQQRGE